MSASGWGGRSRRLGFSFAVGGFLPQPCVILDILV